MKMNATEIQSVKNPVMVLITKDQMAALIEAGYEGTKPIVKLFGGPLTWLVTGIEDGILYGWADLSMQCVEWGGLYAVEALPTMKIGPFYLERDRHFTPKEGADYGSMDSLVGI